MRGHAPCRHCGEKVDAYHQRIWPDSLDLHVTCASSPLVEGVCGHSACCCKAHAGVRR